MVGVWACHMRSRLAPSTTITYTRRARAAGASSRAKRAG